MIIYSANDMRSYIRSNILLLLITLVFLSWRSVFLYENAKTPYISITLESYQVSQVQVYYDRGYGFNEHDSTVWHHENKWQRLWGIIPWPIDFREHQETQYYFQIPITDIYAFKIVPFLKDGALNIKNLEIINGLGAKVLGIDLPNKQSEKIAERFLVNSTIVLDTPILLNQEKIFKKGDFFIRNMIEWFILLFLIVFLMLVINFVVLLPGVQKKVRETLVIGKSIYSEKVILVLITCIYMWSYWRLNEKLFPLFFEKAMAGAMLIFIVKYVIFKHSDFIKLNKLLFFIVLFYAISTVSVTMHHSALLAVQDPDVISFVTNQAVDISNSSGVVFDKYFNIKNLYSDKGSDQTIYLYFFPLLLLVSIAFFGSFDKEWQILTWIPVVFLPNLAVTLFQADWVNPIQSGPGVGSGLFSELWTLRLMLFLVFPLSILAFITSKKWWKKIFFAVITIAILWLLKLTYGRAVIGAILLFVLLFPIVRCWVYGARGFSVKYIGFVGSFVVLLVAGIASPKFQPVMASVLSDQMVLSLNTILHGNLEKDTGEPRPEMHRQAWRLVSMAPVSGWGPSGFQKNAPRLRYMNGDPDGYRHHITNLYLQMATNFGVLGLGIMFSMHLLPLYMVWQVRRNIVLHDERWAVGIAVLTILLMFIIFNMESIVSHPEVNWIYSLYLGFLAAIALKYGYVPKTHINTKWCAAAGVVICLFVAGTYRTSFGSYGYKALQSDLSTRISKEKYPVNEVSVWDSKVLPGEYEFSNTLIKTPANPFHMHYTTKIFSMKAKSAPAKYPAKNIICFQVVVPEQEFPGNIFIWFKVFVDGIQQGEKYTFRMAGNKMIYYDIRNIEKEVVDLHVELDYWKALPYHRDDRELVTQNYMPYHKDYTDVGLSVSVFSLEKR